MLAKGVGLPLGLSFVPFFGLSFIFLFIIPAMPIFYMALIFLSLPVFVASFFRDPKREVGRGIVSPADGTILKVDKKNNSIDIFMGLTDVHVNRSPISGTVLDTRYEKGGSKPAFMEGGEKNQRLKLTLKTKEGEFLLSLITGFFARRIVPYIGEGDELEKGDKIGMIRFGSRVRVNMPTKIKVQVKKGDKVKAGKSTIGVIDD